MRYLSAVDVWLRYRTQNFLFWLGRRFGVTRRQVVVQSGWSFTFLPVLSFLELTTETSIFGLFMAMGLLIVVQGIIALAACKRGLRLLERNEDWGSYSNWEEWRWLRVIEIYLFPLMLFLTLNELILDRDYMEAFYLARPFFLMIMLYGITCRELPPKQTVAQRKAAKSHATAH